MSLISNHTLNLIAEKDLPQADLQYVYNELDQLRHLFDNPTWTIPAAYALHTQPQVGYLAGLMDLLREDRLECLEIIIGRELFWDFEDYPGSVDPEHMEYPEEYPGKSSKDVTITRWEVSVLIEYYLNGNGLTLNERLGYRSATAVRDEERAKRIVEEQRKATAQPQLFQDGS